MTKSKCVKTETSDSQIKSRSRRTILKASTTLAAVFLSVPLAAQSLTDGPLKVLIPFSPGSGTDVVARTLSDSMARSTGQQVIAENKPGAGGTIAGQVIQGLPSDGKNLMMVSSAFAVLPVSGRALPFDPKKDFDVISVPARTPNVLIVSKASGITSLKQLIEQARKAPETLSFSSSGVGTGTHLNAEYFGSLADIKALHVPVKGGPEIMNEIMSGRVDFAFVPPTQVLGHGDDRFTILGVTSKDRLKNMPTVPTISEAGIPNFEYYLWYALLAKSGTPKQVVEKLNKDFDKALSDERLLKTFDTSVIETMRMTPNEAQAFVFNEMAKNEELVRSRGLQLSN